MNKEALFNKIMDILHLDLIKKNPPKTIDDWKKIEDKEYVILAESDILAIIG